MFDFAPPPAILIEADVALRGAGAKHRRLFVGRLIAVAAVIHVQDGHITLHVFDLQIPRVNLFHHAAATAFGFDADGVIRAVELAIAHHELHVARL